MTTDTAWIAALRPGDEVVIDLGRYGKVQYHTFKVAKVTASGRIAIDDYTFNPDGWQRGGDAYHRLRIEQATPELRQRIADMAEHERLEMQIRRTNWTNAPLAQLRAIAAILDAAPAVEG